MYKHIFIFFALFIFAACSSGRLTTDKDSFINMITEVDAEFNDSSFEHAHWGALIKSLDSGETWYRRNEKKMFMPASNQKIVTSASALLTLGPEFRFTTDVYYTGEITDSVLNSDLYIIQL